MCLIKVKSKRLHLDLENLRTNSIEVIAGAFRRGEVVIYPTDTIYGLGCDAFNSSAIQRLNRLKNRNRAKPLLVLIPDRTWVGRLTRAIPGGFQRVADAFWPGPLTMILPAADGLPEGISGSGTIGIRWPRSIFLDKLLSLLPGPLVSTSANVAGYPPLREPAVEEAPILALVDLVVDADRLGGHESTILDFTPDGVPKVLREGAIPRSAIDAVTPESQSWGE